LTRTCSTLCLPIDQDPYRDRIDNPVRFRAWLDECFRQHPELFPEAFADGYRLKDDRVAAKLDRRRRRLRLQATGESFSVRPSVALPYLVGSADDVAEALFLRSCGVPFWAMARVFGRDHAYWYRLEVSLARNRIVGTTVRQAELPEHLLADEHHQTRDGEKNYLATTVAAGGCLGAALTPSADAEDLKTGYGVCKEEAQNVEPQYQPKTVNVDGWASTRLAWAGLFSLVVLLRCFLHGWLNLRSRGQLSAVVTELSTKVGNAYQAPDRRSFTQRLRRLRAWARKQELSAWLLEPVEKLCARAAVGHGLRASRRTSDEQHAGAGDEIDEQVFR
jgi:hypothetical protein